MKLLDEDRIIDLSELFKMFGDSTRVKIMNVLINGETGKIKGEYPKSPVKIAAIIIIILGILFGIYLASSDKDISYNNELQNKQYSELIDYKTSDFLLDEEIF